jgi:hypothetical protein
MRLRCEPCIFEQDGVKMRNLVFKNLTSQTKKRKIISSLEIADREGMRSVIRRHFIGIIREIKDREISESLPSVYILREHNNKEQKGKFLCRIKGYIYLNTHGSRFIIFFIHSLKITLSALPQGLTPKLA